jgi:hypothetical protein
MIFNLGDGLEIAAPGLLHHPSGVVVCMHVSTIRRWTEPARLQDRTATTYRAECTDCGAWSVGLYAYQAVGPKFIGRLTGRPQHETRTES